MNERAKAATAPLTIGGTYFLSSFYDKDGAWVKIVAASTKKNGVGWNSSVEVEVIEPVGDDRSKEWHAPGTKHTVNATNLYVKREDASHEKNARLSTGANP